MTKANALVTLAVSLVTVGVSQLLFKLGFARLGERWEAGDNLKTVVWRALSDPINWLAGLLVLVGVVCWYITMIRLPLSLMLPTAAVIAPVVSVGAYFFLGESLTPAKIAAILVIAAGVAWLAWLNE